jgi:sortase A
LLAAARILEVHRLRHILPTALITAGLLVMLDAGLTVLWQEPLSAAYGSLQQGQARDELDRLEAEFPTPEDLAAVSGDAESYEQVGILADRFEGRIKDGDAIGVIDIDRIDLNAVFLQGTDTGTLQHGPGHYPRTSLPGQPGTVAIAGHRTTYLAPFRHIDSMKEGDRVTLEMPYGTFTYRVQKTAIVDDSAVGIVHKVGYERLVLTACHPLYSASQRYVAFARLAHIAIFDAARGGRFQAN